MTNITTTFGANSLIGTIIPFEVDLDKAKFLEPKSVTKSDALQLLIKQIIDHQTPRKIESYLSVEEKILSIFLSEEVLFGSSELVTANKEELLSQIHHFTSKNQKLEFSLLGLPHKMPNQLLTVETEAGGAEVAMLLQIKYILQSIKSVYSPGAVLHVYCEPVVFGHLADLSEKTVRTYITSVIDLAETLGIDTKEEVIFSLLDQYEPQFANFTEVYLTNIDYYQHNEAEKVEKVRTNFFYTMNDKTLTFEQSRNVFSLNLPLERLTVFEKYQRIDFWERTKTLGIQYLAYNKTRNDLNFMQVIAPNCIRLTVSPKAGSIGIRLVNKNTNLLPYYGYIVISKEGITIKYRADILGNSEKYTGVQDENGKVWFYEEKEKRG